uniref:DNA-(apurinic or apyrimidinic site) endonuclease n=1 Tax=Aureoumbra lagunensis TaxID=44058 RepID=A0A7S3NDW8_9STRA|mmetsp:Transcript_1810/g.2762  ORF Transcript_1810/g.2762 Transcript_1810/m.2762 type:complete len:390 (-) Transcript_1810:375-1544(-)
MDRWLSGCRPLKKPKIESPRQKKPHGDPETIIAWNVNGLASRAQNNRREMVEAMKSWNVDVIFLGEVHLVAHYEGKNTQRVDDEKVSRTRSKPRRQKDTDKRMNAVDALLRDIGDIYSIPPFYSLANGCTAGTAALLRNGGPIPKQIFYTFETVIKYLHRIENGEKGEISTMSEGSIHHLEGRIILMEFESIWLLHTYTPNNGKSDKSFKRREDWESKLQLFLQELQKFSSKSLVYMGDLNIAPNDVDLSDPDWFRNAHQEPLDERNRGQPGCTPGERQNFQELLKAGNLFDAFRKKNPAPPTDSKSPVPDIKGPYYSWRGNDSAQYGVTGRFFGKGMRIDHALISEELNPRLEECKLLGHGVDRIGFMGSDHCPIFLRLSEQQKEGGN